MTMPAPRRILFVHGRKPKPPPEIFRPPLWRCVLEGVRRVDPEAEASMRGNPECFRLVSWYDIFYDTDRDIAQDLDGIERVIRIKEAAPEDVAEASSWHRRLRRALYRLSDRFPALMERFADQWIRDTVGDTLRYLQDSDGLATRVRERVIEALEEARREGARVLLIGHSLGSVAAYEALWVLSHERRRPLPVDLFMTLGSPLGTHFIQRALLGYHSAGSGRFPHGIRRWHNLATVGDLAALDPDVADDFAPMLELGLLETLRDNTRELYGAFRSAAEGLNVHRSYGYLVQPAVGELVGGWWRGGGSAGARGHLRLPRARQPAKKGT